MKYYLQLIRPINLLFLAATMLLFRYAFVTPNIYFQYDFAPYFDNIGFLLLLISTLLVAAGGYVINDVFDVEIDAINKPQKQIVEKHMTDLSAFNFYKILVILSLIATVALCIHQREYKISSIPVFVMAFLYMYAQQFKKQLLIGNIVIALCAAMPLLMQAFYEFRINISDTETVVIITKGILYASFIYGIFAFLTTLCREVVKDIEDIEGDSQHECNTLPIKFGVVKSKWFIYFIHLLLFIFHASFISLYKNVNYTEQMIFHIILLLLPLVVISISLFIAKTKAHFSRISMMYKLYQLIGVATMWYFHVGTGSYFFMLYFNHLKKWL